MGYSSEYLMALRDSGGVAREVEFDLVVAFDFYDGPETGFAFYCSGEGLRFSVIGESKYPILRAFAFALLEGNWRQLIREVEVTATLPRLPGGNVVFTSSSDAAMALNLSVSDATEGSYYVGVGHAHLHKLAISAISKDQLDALKRRQDFYAVHRYIKGNR